MRLLLDTHVLLRAMLESRALGAAAVELLEAPEHDVFFSAVDILEIAIKAGLDRPGFDADPRAVAANVHLLPPLHEDPFDRLLLSQAQIEGMTLLTRDAAVLRCGALAMAI